MVIGNSSNKFWKGIVSSTPGWRVEDSVIQDCASNAIELSAGSSLILHNKIINNGGVGVVESGAGSPNKYIENIIAGNTGDGLNITNGGGTVSGNLIIRGNIIYNNGGDGIELSGTSLRMLNVLECKRNIITENGGYGINGSSLTDAMIDFYGAILDWNAFYINTSDEVNGITNGDNDITLSADPFVDSANGDFNINNTAGGGADLRDEFLAIDATLIYLFRQWVSDDFGGGTTIAGTPMRRGMV
jgi:hypothetical protein